MIKTLKHDEPKLTFSLRKITILVGGKIYIGIKLLLQKEDNHKMSKIIMVGKK